MVSPDLPLSTVTNQIAFDQRALHSTPLFKRDGSSLPGAGFQIGNFRCHHFYLTDNTWIINNYVFKTLPLYPRTSFLNKKWRNMNKGHCWICKRDAKCRCIKLNHVGDVMSNFRSFRYIRWRSWLHQGIGVSHASKWLLSMISPHEHILLMTPMHWNPLLYSWIMVFLPHESWYPSDVLNIIQCTLGTPNILIISIRCTICPSMYWTFSNVMNIFRCEIHSLCSEQIFNWLEQKSCSEFSEWTRLNTHQ